VAARLLDHCLEALDVDAHHLAAIFPHAAVDDEGIDIAATAA
jgi:hypothetical protein